MNEDTIRRQLAGKREELLANLNGIRADVMSAKGRVAEDDLASMEHEEFISIQRNSLTHGTLLLVNEAIERLETGEYGICQACEEPVSEKRLRALPWAKYCVPCQERIALRETEMTPAGSLGLDGVELYA